MQQARRTRIGRELIDATTLQALFELRGEDIIRRSTGRVVKPPARHPPMVFIKWLGTGRQANMLYHRIKFALAHGWLPEDVDHRDTDDTNHSLDNLRAATHGQNMCNRGPVPRKDDLPRGVYKHQGRLMAKITYKCQQVYLGVFNTQEEASQVVEAKLRELHGEFYHAPLQR